MLQLITVGWRWGENCIEHSSLSPLNSSLSVINLHLNAIFYSMVGWNYMQLYTQYMATYSKTQLWNPSIASQCINGNSFVLTWEQYSTICLTLCILYTCTLNHNTRPNTKKHIRAHACSHTAFSLASCQVKTEENGLAAIFSLNVSVLRSVMLKKI